MRHTVTTLIFSLFLSLGTGVAFADRHNDRGHDRERKEQRFHGNHKDKKKDKGRHKDRHDKSHKGHKKDYKHGDMRPGHHGNKHHGGAPRPGFNDPSYGHGPHHHHAPAPPMPPRLKHMVHHATRGCHDVDVWQVNHDTYIVKYRKGRRYYTQYLYPYSERYGNINPISLNWQPLSPWNLIPRIQLNINL